jgi:hypothetical protein
MSAASSQHCDNSEASEAVDIQYRDRFQFGTFFEFAPAIDRNRVDHADKLNLGY